MVKSVYKAVFFGSEEDVRMRSITFNIFVLFLCFGLFMPLLPAAFAESEIGQVYDSSVITGFEPADYVNPVNTDYKYTLIELRKEFPTRINAKMGGEVSYQETGNGSRKILSVSGYLMRTIDIDWKCLENYDDQLDVYHFVPDLEKYQLADGLELPVITVNVLGQLTVPPLTYTRSGFPVLPDSISEDKHIAKAALPSSYNASSNGSLPTNLPQIRNQNPYGTCWAFAAIAAVEADLIHDGYATISVDLSELHLAYFTTHDFYDEKNCNTGDLVTVSGLHYLDVGGDSLVAGMRMANMLGPVQETNAPYSLVKNDKNAYSPGTADGRNGSFQVTGVYILESRDAIKNAILEHGAVAASYCDVSDTNGNSPYFSDTYSSYYCPENYAPNHAIALVGWDDNFPGSHFSSDAQPSGDGAWLVRNSWGVNQYSHFGYFWMSYYDQTLTSEAVAIDAQPRQYDHVYAYDNSPVHNNYPFPQEVTVSQVFHVNGGEEISAIGFTSDETRTGWKFTVSAGNRKVTKTVSFSDPGYHLVTLPNTLPITSDTDVTVEYAFVSDQSFDYLFHSYEEDHSIVSYNENGVLVGEVSYTQNCGSGLLTHGSYYDDFVLGRDAKIKLFTNDAADTYELVLPANLTTIGSEAFAGAAFSSVKLQEKVVSIGRHAFADCANLTKIYIPKSTTQIDDQAFANVTDLTIVGVSGSTAESFAESHGFTFKPGS